MWPDVARRLPTLAPNLAPRKLVSSANSWQAGQAADPPPPKPAAMISPGYLSGGTVWGGWSAAESQLRKAVTPARSVSDFLIFNGQPGEPGRFCCAKSLPRIAARETTPDTSAMTAATSRMRCRPVVKTAG